VNLVATASGSTVTLTWGAPASGDPVVTYILEGGSASGLANLANMPTNSTSTTFSASGVANGTYYVRMRAQNAAGTSAASNEAILVVGGGPCPPNAPSGLTSTVSGTTVTLSWTAPSGVCPVTSYLLQAGSAPGFVNLASANLGTATSYVARVARGVYYVRVFAVNGNLQSAPSNEVVVTVTQAGIWSYALSVRVPLNATPITTCTAPAAGTMVVSGSGAFTIPFSVACERCAMSGTMTGTIDGTHVSGTVTGSISGPIDGPGGCTNQQPAPAQLSGGCTSGVGSLNGIILKCEGDNPFGFILTPP
jgi:hypothetical protein